MLADWQSANPIHGRTEQSLGPRAHARRLSGGSAAAVAAGLSALEVGSDIGGSIRVPAVFCGVYGHRPSETLLPKSGQFPFPPLPNALRVMGVQGSIAAAPRTWSWRFHPRRPRSGRGCRLAGRVAARPPGPTRRFPRGGAAPIPWLVVDDEIRQALEELRRASAGSAPPSRRSSPMSSGPSGPSPALPVAALRDDERGRDGRPAPAAHRVLEAGGRRVHPREPARPRVRPGDFVLWGPQREGFRQAWRAFFRDWDVLLAPPSMCSPTRTLRELGRRRTPTSTSRSR